MRRIPAPRYPTELLWGRNMLQHAWGRCEMVDGVAIKGDGRSRSRQLLVRKREQGPKRWGSRNTGLIKNPSLTLYSSHCLAFQGQKGVLCGSDLLSVFPTAGLISVSNSSTCCRGAVYYRLIKAVNGHGNPVSNLQYYPDLSLSRSSHRAIKVTSFREHSHLPSVSCLMLFFFSWEELWTFLGWVTWRCHWKASSSPSRVCSTHETWGFSLSLLNALLPPLVFLKRLEIMKWAQRKQHSSVRDWLNKQCSRQTRVSRDL